MGFGYDDSQLAEQRHPTREDLDAVSADVPIYLIHQSGHLGAANSAALAQVGITADSPDPPGGVIRRAEGGTEPNGVLEELAHLSAFAALLGQLGPEGPKELVRAGTQLLARYGYTTGQEARAFPPHVAATKEVAAEGGLEIDLLVYPDVLVDRELIAREVGPTYEQGLRIGGAKLTIDGTPQGFTAWRDRPYYAPPAHLRADYVGYPAATADQVFDAVDWAYANDIQILTHANGEAASDLLIAAIETAAAAHGGGDRRPALIHGQFLREDQIDAFQRLGVNPSLFPMHTFYWGDWHRDRTVGPSRADDISPTGWAVTRGMIFSTHHDAPVAFPDSMRVLDATVTRRSRSGDIIGPAQRVDVMTALKAMTIWPATMHFEETDKGSIAVGKLADLVILSGDPTAVDPETLDTLEVVETVNAGATIYAAEADPLREGRLRPTSDGSDPFADFLRQAAVSAETPTVPGPAWRARYARSLASAPHPAACLAGFLQTALAPNAPARSGEPRRRSSHVVHPERKRRRRRPRCGLAGRRHGANRPGARQGACQSGREPACRSSSTTTRTSAMTTATASCSTSSPSSRSPSAPTGT